MQIVNAQSKLRAELLQKLRKDFLLKAKVKEAAEVKHATNGLSQMKAKAVENDMHMALKQKANDYAEKQVEVQLAGKSAEQKEKMLKEIIAMKAKARVMLTELIKDQAKSVLPPSSTSTTRITSTDCLSDPWSPGTQATKQTMRNHGKGLTLRRLKVKSTLLL